MVVLDSLGADWCGGARLGAFCTLEQLFVASGRIGVFIPVLRGGDAFEFASRSRSIWRCVWMPFVFTIDSAADPNWSCISLKGDKVNKVAWFWTIFAFVVAALYLLTGDFLLVGGITLVVAGIFEIRDARKHPAS